MRNNTILRVNFIEHNDQIEMAREAIAEILMQKKKTVAQPNGVY